MERLTYRNKNGEARFAGEGTAVDNFKLIPAILEKLAAYEDTGVEPKEIEDRQDVCLWIPEDRFTEIVNAEAEGRLAVLPCKVGDMVYHPTLGKGYVVAGYLRGKHKVFYLVCFDDEEHIYSEDDFGKTVFLSNIEGVE